MDYQPNLPITEISPSRAYATHPSARQIQPENALRMLEHLKKELTARRDTIQRYLRLYQQKASSPGSGAIVNALAFTVADYNGTLREMYAPQFPPVSYLFIWEEIHFNLHLMAAAAEPEPYLLPELPTDMELLQYIRRG